MLLYILVDIEKLPQHLKLVGNIARLFDSGILITYFSSEKKGLEDFEDIQQEIKSMSNHSKVKFSFFRNTANPCVEIKRIKQEKDICALAFPSEKETLTHSIFGNSQLHTSMPIFAL